MKKLLLLLLILGVFSSCSNEEPKEDLSLSAEVDSLAHSHALDMYYQYKAKAATFEDLRLEYDTRVAIDSIDLKIKLEYVQLSREMTDSLNKYDRLADQLVSVGD